MNSWRKLSVVVIAGFVMVNAYVSYLQSRINPFIAPIPLWQEGYSERFEIGYGSFHPTSYVLALALARPMDEDQVPRGSWADTEEQVRQDLDVEFRVALRDSSGRSVISHYGGLERWTLTTHSYVFAEKGVGAFWQHNFDARFFEKYVLEVEVVRPSPNAQRYNPTLVLEGIEDGYFWLVRPALNVLWGVMVLALAILIGLWRLAKRRAAT